MAPAPAKAPEQEVKEPVVAPEQPKTALVEQKSAVSKFEMEFVDFEDPDNEDDDGQKQEKKLQVNVKKDLKLEDEEKTKDEHEKQMIRVRNSVKKIEENLSGANSSIQRREAHINDLKKLVATQHGLAKKELNKVLLKSQSLLEKLQVYSKEGTELLNHQKAIAQKEEDRIRKEKEEAERKKKAAEEAIEAEKKAAEKA